MEENANNFIKFAKIYQVYSKRLAVVSISISIYCYLIAKVIILPKLLDVAEVVVNSPNVNIHDRRIDQSSSSTGQPGRANRALAR